MIYQLIGLLIVNSFLCFGIREAATEGGILFPLVNLYNNLGEFLFNKLGKKNWINSVFQFIAKPLFGCVSCMATFWGVTFILLIGSNLLGGISIELTLTYILSLSGLNTLISAWLDNLRMSF